MERKGQIISENLSYATLANDIDCIDEQSYASEHIRRKVDHFFDEDQVIINKLREQNLLSAQGPRLIKSYRFCCIQRLLAMPQFLRYCLGELFDLIATEHGTRGDGSPCIKE